MEQRVFFVLCGVYDNSRILNARIKRLNEEDWYVTSVQKTGTGYMILARKMERPVFALPSEEELEEARKHVLEHYSEKNYRPVLTKREECVIMNPLEEGE